MSFAISSFLERRASRLVVVITLLVLAGFYVRAVLNVWRADWLQDDGRQQSLEASVSLEPWDARTHWLLGRHFLNASQDPPQALTSLNRAVTLNPYDGRYWLDVAAAYQVTGEVAETQKALEQALRAEPTSPSIAWDAATFYLAQKDVTRALPLFRTAMEYDSANTVAGIDLCWRATGSVSQVVSQALPADPIFYFAFLKILTDRQQAAPAIEVWRALTARKFKFPVESVFHYFDYLIATHQIDQAEEVWKFLGQSDGELLASPPSNMISDGGFEGKYLNGGFGWRDEPYAQVDVSVDTSEFHSGTRALRLMFSGPAFAESGIFQYVAVRPNSKYRLSAFVKSQDIMSASGPRLVVQDFYSHQLLTSGDDLLGTSGWREQSMDFLTGPDTRLVVLKVMRIPGNPLIKGTYWLDDVTLTAIENAEAKP